MNHASGNQQEDQNDVIVGPIEMNAELEVNNSYLKWGSKLEGIIQKVVKIFLAKKQIPAKISSLKIYKKIYST